MQSVRERVLMLTSVCCYYSGLVHLSRWWTRRTGRRLLILNYHQASGGELRRHLLYLRRHFRIVPLEMALQELYAPCREKLPRKDRRLSLALTFDDGYYDNYTNGFKLARELQIPITIFLITGYIEHGTAFWWYDHLIQHAQVDEATFEGRTYNLRHQEECLALAQAIDGRIGCAASVAEQAEILNAIRKMLAVPPSVAPGGAPALLLTWSQVREMDASGWVSFGAHTVHHPTLASLTDRAELQREIKECGTILEQQLGHPIDTFAYPHGGREHIGEHGPRVVQQTGYAWAMTTLPGFNTPGSDPYLLRRFSADARLHWLVIAVMTSGLWSFLSRLHSIATRCKRFLTSL